jgi:hypothetical protein
MTAASTHSPSSTDNNAYHINRLAKNSVSIPCHKAKTCLLSGMILAGSMADHLKKR